MSFPKAPLTRWLDKVGSDAPGPGHYDLKGENHVVAATFAKGKRFQTNAKQQANLEESCICPHSSHKRDVVSKKRCIVHDSSARKLFATPGSSTRPIKRIIRPETTSKPAEDALTHSEPLKGVEAPVADAPQNFGALLAAVASDEDVHLMPPPPCALPSPPSSAFGAGIRLDNGTAAEAAEEDAVMFAGSAADEDFGSWPVSTVTQPESESEYKSAKSRQENVGEDIQPLPVDESSKDEEVDVGEDEPETQHSVMMDDPGKVVLEDESEPELSIKVDYAQEEEGENVEQENSEQIVATSEADKEKIAAMERKMASAHATLHRMKEQATLVMAERDEKFARLHKMRDDHQSVSSQLEEKEKERVRLSERKAQVEAGLEEYERKLEEQNRKKDRLRDMVRSFQPELQRLEGEGFSGSLVRDVKKARNIFADLVGQHNPNQNLKKTKQYVEACDKLTKDNADMSANIRVMQKQIAAAKEGLREIEALLAE